jgi:hypothetical protein
MVGPFGRKKRQDPANDVQVVIRDAKRNGHAAMVSVYDGEGRLVHSHKSGDFPVVHGKAMELRKKMMEDMRSGKASDSMMSESRINIRRGALGDRVEWSFRTNSIVTSDTVDQGVIGMSPWAFEEMHAKAGSKVVVRHGGRSKAMRLRTSPGLTAFEVELNERDIEEIGLTDGETGYLEVMSESAGRNEEMMGGPGPRKVKIPAGSSLKTDSDKPPYTVDDGFGYWRRRKRE